MAARITVTLTKNVPAQLAASLGLAATDQQVGDVLSLPTWDARALVAAAVARYGSAAEDAADTPTVAQGAALGASVAETRVASSLARTIRVDPPRPAMPTVSWLGSSPSGMDAKYLLTLSNGTVGLVNPQWGRVVNCTPENLQIDQTYYTMAAGYNGSGTPGPLVIEASTTTDRLVLACNPIAGGGVLAIPGNIEVWVDDAPLYIPAGPTNGAHSAAWLDLRWATKGKHVIRLSLTLVSVTDAWVSTGDTLTATTAPGSGIRLAVLGDSWVEGALGVSATLARLLPRYLGLDDAAVCGQGGTGYVATGGGGNKSVYGSANRVNALVANNPTDVVIFGTINDNAQTPSAIQSAAATLYGQLAAALPAARQYVVLPQPAGVADAASANHIANREAIRTAAAAASKVVAVIDPSDWLTGTGWSTGRTGDGNRDLFLGSDNTHPTANGHHYFAQRLAEILQRWLHA